MVFYYLAQNQASGATLYSGRRYRCKPLDKIMKEISRWRRKNYSIEVVASCVLGWDTDEEDVLNNTLEFALDADIDMPEYFSLIPFPEQGSMKD